MIDAKNIQICDVYNLFFIAAHYKLIY